MPSLKDSAGNELVYWPISGLKEGDDSEVLTFTVTLLADTTGTDLRATPDSRIKIWAKRTADVSYIDITVSPYSLAGLSGTVEFKLYVECLTPISGLERVPVSVSVVKSQAALWDA